MATRLSQDVGVQLLANSAATAGALVALIFAFGGVSGAHFNPVVTLVDRAFGTITSGAAGLYVVAQVFGGCLGTVVANLMFDLPAVELSTTVRSWGDRLSEVVATAGLLLRHPRLQCAPGAPMSSPSPSAGSAAPTGSRPRPASPTRP